MMLTKDSLSADGKWTHNRESGGVLRDLRVSSRCEHLFLLDSLRTRNVVARCPSSDWRRWLRDA